MRYLVLISIICFSMQVSASSLKYTPANPSFGGNPFGGSFLQGTAGAQKRFQEPEDVSDDPLEDFAKKVKNSLLSRISRNIADKIVGDDAEESGRFVVGDTVLEFEQVDGQVVINIDDTATGASTTIEVPVSDL